MAGFNYDDVVMYPFGYGLSYTTFSQQMGALNVSGTTATVDVTVTNTGSTAGKDVVELYYTPPYTEGGIEKASVNLVAFDKTDLLEPGQTQTLTLTFELKDMASYDTNGTGGYILEAGDYIISLRTDSHTVVDSQTYTVADHVTYGANNLHNGDLIAAENRFGFAAGDVTYLSRADGFANFAAATAAPSMSMPEADKALFVNNSNYVIPTDPNVVMPTTGAKNGMTVQELRGASYDDERWETLLDNLTISEMNNMIALGGYQTAPAASVGKVATTDCDGPAALNNNFTNVGSVGFPAGVMIACTWTNEQAMRELYFKPFEICIKDNLAQGGASAGHPMAVMSSYNYIGTQWAGACDHLLNNVLRDEWGFRGSVLTDYFANFGYMDADRAVRGGTDIMLGTAGNEAIMTDQTSATSVLAMRQATKNIFYTTVNSTAYENYTPGSIPSWLMTTYIVDRVIAAALVVLEIFAIRGYMKKKGGK